MMRALVVVFVLVVFALICWAVAAGRVDLLR